MLTRYEFEQITESVQSGKFIYSVDPWLCKISDRALSMIRVISFLVEEKMQNYSTNKASYEGVDIELRFHQYQADFIADIYRNVQKKIDRRLIEADEKLVQINTTDIPLSADGK